MLTPIISNTIIPVLIGILVISVVIIAHELGHFFTAKAVGARVEEFGIGFPPRLFGIKWGDTLYSVNAIPFGGFNRLTGEVDPSAPGSLASKSKAARVLVLGGGILVNLILPVLFFSISYMVPHDEIQEPVVVKSVVPDTPAAQAGIRAGDTILSIDGKPLENLTDLLRTVQLNLGKEITLGVSHSDGTTATVKVIPRWKPPPNQGALGIELDIETATAHSVVLRRSYPFWEAIPRGITSLWQTLVLYKDGIISLFVGTAPLTLAGPVGIVQMTGEVARAGFAPLMEFASFISIALAITQILPLPALDGGHIAFVVLEWIRRGKRVSPKVEGMVHTIGFILLLALMLAITYQDIARIISGKSLLQ